MGIEKPHQQFGTQRDLFEDATEKIEVTPALPTFDELCSRFFELTGYKASAYSLVSEQDDLEKLRIVVDELESTPESDRNAYLMGLAAEMEAGTKWWMK